MRVTAPGGRVGLASWTPAGFLGEFFKVVAAHVPPMPGVRSPLLWGTTTHIEDLFAGASAITHTTRYFVFRYRSGYRRMLADDIRLSQLMADIVGRHPELQFQTQALSITTFRYVPLDLRPTVGEPATEQHLDALNRTLLDRLQRGGEAFVSNAVIHGRYLLRACIVNFHTTEADVQAVPEIVARTGRLVDAELRPRS